MQHCKTIIFQLKIIFKNVQNMYGHLCKWGLVSSTYNNNNNKLNETHYSLILKWKQKKHHQRKETSQKQNNSSHQQQQQKTRLLRQYASSVKSFNFFLLGWLLYSWSERRLIYIDSTAIMFSSSRQRKSKENLYGCAIKWWSSHSLSLFLASFTYIRVSICRHTLLLITPNSL